MPVVGQPVQFSVESGPVTLPMGTVITDINGIAQITPTAVADSAGAAVVRAELAPGVSLDFDLYVRQFDATWVSFLGWIISALRSLRSPASRS